MGAQRVTLLSKTGRTADVNTYSTGGGRINTMGWHSITFFLDANAPVAGSVGIDVMTTDDAIDTAVGTVTSFTLGSFADVSGAASKEILSFSIYNDTGFGSNIWIKTSMSGGATVTFGIGAIFRS